SGGLLLALPQERAGTLVDALKKRGVTGTLIGEILESSEPYIEVVA
ncbi:MAG: hydrogenase, partial [Proteobacteria bacterium]|nr:hydrogenase [Pseudomonadota bacterium]